MKILRFSGTSAGSIMSGDGGDCGGDGGNDYNNVGYKIEYRIISPNNDDE